jgi:hypothetical protein
MISFLLVVSALCGLQGCDKPPVVWNDPVSIPLPAGTVRLVIDSSNTVRFAAERGAPRSLPSAAGLCSASVRTAPGTVHLYAVWWSVRADSSAVLYSASSPDSGATWSLPVPVDTADRSAAGCTRPPPALTVVGDDVHVAYAMTAPEGTGVFFSHFMYGMFHSPEAVIYGERLVATSIAAQGDTVAVAYEEPNGSRERIDLALSTTMGHIFEWRTEATRDVDNARAPSVALRGKTIAVAWMPAGARDSATAGVARTGLLQ